MRRNCATRRICDRPNFTAFAFVRRERFLGDGRLALFAGIEWGKETAQLIAGVAGTSTAMQVFSHLGDKKKAKLAAETDRFFVPWLIQEEAASYRDHP